MLMKIALILREDLSVCVNLVSLEYQGSAQVSEYDVIRGLSQIVFPTVSVIMTLSPDPPPLASRLLYHINCNNELI